MAKLYFRYGAMNSGKSTAILQVAHNYEERGMNVIIIKPSIDTKGNDKIVSRIGAERTVDLLVDQKDEILFNIAGCVMRDEYKEKEISCIIVDEAQFLTAAQIEDLYKISKKLDTPVICYGLRCDFKMNGFGGSTRLLQLADDIEELKTICRCGKKATQNVRFKNDKPVFDGEQVAIDDNSNIKYESVCGECYFKLYNC